MSCDLLRMNYSITRLWKLKDSTLIRIFALLAILAIAIIFLQRCFWIIIQLNIVEENHQHQIWNINPWHQTWNMNPQHQICKRRQYVPGDQWSFSFWPKTIKKSLTRSELLIRVDCHQLLSILGKRQSIILKKTMKIVIL